MSDTCTSSRLLSLPRELRDEIYIKLFEDDIYEIDNPTAPALPATAGLLLSCSQLHDEAIEFYYQHTTFVFRTVERGAEWLYHILCRYLRLINHVIYDTNAGYSLKHCMYCEPEEAREDLRDLDSVLAEYGIHMARGVVKGTAVWSDGDDVLVEEFGLMFDDEAGEWRADRWFR